MAGLTPTGFVIKTLAEVKTELETATQGALGPDVDVSATSVFGQIIGVFAAPVAELWEVAQVLDSARSPDNAGGAALDDVCLLSGLTRTPASRTLLRDIELVGSPGATIPINTVFRSAAGDLYNLKSTVVLNGLGAAGGSGSGINAEAQETGPLFVAESATLTVVTPGTTLTQVLSDYPAVIGRDTETDSAFRSRRQQALSRAGSATVAALRAAVLAVPNVISCTVYENTTNVTNSNGLPARSFEVVFDDGGLSTTEQNDRVAQAIYNAKPAGIASYGLSSGIAVDANGASVSVGFSRVTLVDLDLFFTVQAVAGVFPATGAEQVKLAAQAYVNSLLPGQDVVLRRLYEPAFSVIGVQDVTFLSIGPHGGADDPSTFPISPRQRAVVNAPTNVAVGVVFVEAT